jgi:YegS/Rv2252/BmrU family lipid kinase
MEPSLQKAFVVYNPKAGDENQADELRAVLQRYFTAPEWSFEIYEITGKEDVTAICRTACDQGSTLVVSAGGDGTVMSVASALVQRPTPMGVLPLGTGNLLSKILNIPQKLDEAARLLVEEHVLIEIDTLKVGERYLLLNVSVGISPIIMNETAPAEKKRFGMLAYFWTTIKSSSLFNLQRYTLTIDGQPRRVRASEILISNTTFLEKATSLYGPPETLTDGQFEVYLTTADSLGDYLHLLWDLLRGSGRPGAKLSHWESQKSIRIEAARTQLVQGDGEVIGQTPVEVQLVPRAVKVIMPKSSKQ